MIFTGRNVTFLEIEKYTRNGKRHISGIILKGEFFSKDKYIRLITDNKAVQKNISFNKYFYVGIQFFLFFSFLLILVISIVFIKNKRKYDN